MTKLTAIVRATIQRNMSCIVSAVRDLDEVRRSCDDRLALTADRKVAQKSVLRLYCPPPLFYCVADDARGTHSRRRSSEVKRSFCKHCDSPMVPGVTAIVRLSCAYLTSSRVCPSSPCSQERHASGADVHDVPEDEEDPSEWHKARPLPDSRAHPLCGAEGVEDGEVSTLYVSV